MVLVSGKTWWTPYQWANPLWLRVSWGDQALASRHPQDADAYFRDQEEENDGGRNGKEAEEEAKEEAKEEVKGEAKEEAEEEAKKEAKERNPEQEENETGAKEEEEEECAVGSKQVEETAGEKAATEREKGNSMEMIWVNK